MNKSNNIQNLRIELDKALELINEKTSLQSSDESRQLSSPTMASDSLLLRCQKIVKETEKLKPKLRVIRHMACSGGSLISKCIDAMPNVYLMSEVHPLARKHLGEGGHKFTPSDIISCAYYAGMPNIEKLSEEIFASSIKVAIKALDSTGSHLVLREHSHTDFCAGSQALNSNSVTRLLSEEYDVLSLITLRNPIDSYLSLKKNRWIQFEPETFDEYCKRILQFLDTYQKSKVVYYENFVKSPKKTVKTMKDICEAIQIPYVDDFLAYFDVRKITGDSGRSSKDIVKKTRRITDDEIMLEIKNSKHYKKFINKHKFYKNLNKQQ
jgi:hypothetical protein